jgi:hypothetical protein
VGGTAVGEGVEGDLGGGVLGLAEGGAVVGALEDLAVKVNSGLEPGRVVRTLSNARVGGEVEAAPLGQLLKLVLVHFFSSPTLYYKSTSPLSQSRLFSEPDRIRGFPVRLKQQRFRLWDCILRRRRERKFERDGGWGEV